MSANPLWKIHGREAVAWFARRMGVGVAVVRGVAFRVPGKPMWWQARRADNDNRWRA